jgi:hypothetical protein
MILSILVTLFTTLVTPVDTSIHTTVEAQAIVSDAGVTPFWMRSLQYGSVPMENPGLVLRAWNGKSYNLKKKYDWKYEVEATGWTGKQNDFWLTQAYISGRRGKWELWAGRRKEVYGLGDTSMTAGFYAWSGNAVPIPKIQLGTRDYLNFAKGWLGVHMTYSHGWFDNQGPVINAYLHQKSLYGRIGKQNSLIKIFAGLNHQAMWGGEKNNSRGDLITKYGNGLNTYFYVVTLTKNRTIVAVDPNAPDTESGYQYGAHLGSIDLMVSLDFNKAKIEVYRQNSWETGRVASLIHANDGLNGVSIKLKKKSILSRIAFEYLYTANMGSYASGVSKLLNIKDPHPGEIENYFNNTHGGWHYIDRGIGTPFIVYDLKNLNNGGYYFTFNAVKAYYLSFAGEIMPNISYMIKMSQSFHSKTPVYNLENIFDMTNKLNSLGIIFNQKINERIAYFIEAGLDQGKLLKNSRAIRLGINMKIN